MLSARNRWVRQIASHVAVRLGKAAHRVQSVADADAQAGTQPKVVAHVMQRSVLIALLKGVERHDGCVRQRLCGVVPHAALYRPGGLVWYAYRACEICLLSPSPGPRCPVPLW